MDERIPQGWTRLSFRMTWHPTQHTNVSLNQQGLPTHYPYRPDWEITPRELVQKLSSPNPPVLLDCRTPGEWERVHLPQARLVPLQSWAAHLGELETLKDHPLVVYCHHGMRSLQLTMLLRQNGFAEVRSLAGGIELWAIDIEPGMARY